jgi:hypothetical protein
MINKEWKNASISRGITPEWEKNVKSEIKLGLLLILVSILLQTWIKLNAPDTSCGGKTIPHC